MKLKQIIEKFREKGYLVKKEVEYITNVSTKEKHISKMGYCFIIGRKEFAEIEFDEKSKKWDIIIYSKYAYLKLQKEGLLIGNNNWCWFTEGFDLANKKLDEMEKELKR